MSQMIVRHQVKNFEKWVPFFNAGEPLRKLNGQKFCRIFRNTANTDDIVILFEWDNVQKALQFAQSDELRLAMKQSGVKDEPYVYLLEEDLEK